MPGDTSAAPSTTGGGNKLKNKWRRQRSSLDSDIPACVQDTMLPDHLRQKLQSLFSQIENEFEKLYAENAALQERLEVLSGRSEGRPEVSSNGVDRSEANDQVDGAPPKQANSKKDEELIPMTTGGHLASIACINLHRYIAAGLRYAASTQLSQKIISTYKTSTSRLANTFKTTSSNQSACGRFIRHFSGHADGVWEVSVSRYGPRVIGTASADYTSRVWCIETGRVLLQYYGHRGSVNSIRFHPSNDLVLTASGDQTAHIWRASIPVPSLLLDSVRSSSEDDTDPDDMSSDRNGDTCNTHFIHAPLMSLSCHKNVVAAADWFSNRSHVITASWDGTAMVFDSETGNRLDTLYGHENELTNVTSHPTQLLALTSSKDSSVRLWDLRDAMVKVNAFMGHSSSVTSAVFSGADKIISGSDDRTVKCWDMRNMTAPYVTIRSDSPINRLSVSPTTNVIAVPHDNRHIRLYDLSGNRLGRLPRNNRVGHSRMVCSTAWNDDSNSMCNLFSSGFEKNILSWSINAKITESKDNKKAN